jgi:hypothetical protein
VLCCVCGEVDVLQGVVRHCLDGVHQLRSRQFKQHGAVSQSGKLLVTASRHLLADKR